MASRVTDPNGKAWIVRRRWFPWRRALSLRSLWHSTPDGDKSAEEPSNEETSKPKESGNLFLTVVLGTIGGIFWLVTTAGKAVLILLAALLAITLSLAPPRRRRNRVCVYAIDPPPT